MLSVTVMVMVGTDQNQRAGVGRLRIGLLAPS
jgi:hypothetical protein